MSWDGKEQRNRSQRRCHKPVSIKQRNTKGSKVEILNSRILITWKGPRFHPVPFRARSSDRGYMNTTPEKHCLFTHIRKSKCLELLLSKQATLIEIPDGFVFPGILSKKHVTVSRGATGRRAHNLYPKSEGSQQMRSWSRNSTREMGPVMKTHKSVLQQPWCHNFQTPSQRAGPLVSNSFSWVIEIPEVDWKLQPSSYHHIQSQILVGIVHCESLCHWCVQGQLGHLRDAQVIQKSLRKSL